MPLLFLLLALLAANQTETGQKLINSTAQYIHLNGVDYVVPSTHTEAFNYRCRWPT